MSNPIVSLKNVSRSFDRGTIRALNDVSLAIERGESVALSGPSGSGKSTLLNIIGTLDFASAGEVRIGGEVIIARQSWDSFRNGKIGFVFQLFHLIPDLSLVENIEMALMPQALTRADRRERSIDMLKRVGLEKRSSSYPANVSGGERQRAAIARALVTAPEIVLADEPTGNLDSKSANEVLDLLESVSIGEGKTLVLVTHNMEFARRMKRIVRLEDGEIVG